MGANYLAFITSNESHIIVSTSEGDERDLNVTLAITVVYAGSYHVNIPIQKYNFTYWRNPVLTDVYPTTSVPG